MFQIQLDTTLLCCLVISMLWSEGKFRVNQISKLKGIQKEPFNLLVEKVPIKEGLGIEYKIDDSYIVIAFVKPNKDGMCDYESVGTRIENTCETWDDVVIFRKALKFAMEEILKYVEEEYEQTKF